MIKCFERIQSRNKNASKILLHFLFAEIGLQASFYFIKIIA